MYEAVSRSGIKLVALMYIFSMRRQGMVQVFDAQAANQPIRAQQLAASANERPAVPLCAHSNGADSESLVIYCRMVQNCSDGSQRCYIEERAISQTS